MVVKRIHRVRLLAGSMIYMTTSYWGDITVMLINFAYQKFSMNTRVIEI